MIGEIHVQDKAYVVTNNSRLKKRKKKPPDKAVMFSKMSNSSVQKNLHSKNKACRRNKRCTGKEIKDRITNIACTSFICHLQPPVTTASHYLLDRW